MFICFDTFYLWSLMMPKKNNRKGTKHAPDRKKPKPSETGPKFEPQQIPEVLEIVAKFRRRGYSQNETAEEVYKVFKVRVSQPMICKYEKTIHEQYKQATIESREAYVEQECQAFMDIIKEAWIEWDRSKENARKIMRKFFEAEDCKSCGGTGVNKNGGECSKCEGVGRYQRPNEKTKTVEGRLGASEYLRVMLDAHRQICELRGLKPVASQLINNTLNVNASNGVNWGQLLFSNNGPPKFEDTEIGKQFAALENGTVQEPVRVKVENETQEMKEN